MTPAEQAAEAERQRIAAQARQAREAGVMIRSAGGSPAASIALALGSAPKPSAPDADETGRSDGDGVAFDLGSYQYKEQCTLACLCQQLKAGVKNHRGRENQASHYEERVENGRECCRVQG